jgi:UDP-N-acetyl-D-mannosaminuronate dehydrogenase
MPLQEKILHRRARIGILGLDCIGLPLAVEFAELHVGGSDVDTWRVEQIRPRSRT